MHRIGALAHHVADHPVAAAAVAIGSFVLSIAVTLIVIVRLPTDYFVGPSTRPWFPNQPAPLRLLLHLARNVVGLTLIVLGVVMSLPGVPGQGILTILLGVMLTDLPGKRRLERWLVSRRLVRRGIDRIRARYGKPPISTE